MLCDYGCGNETLYLLKNGKGCCSKRPTACPEIRAKNSMALKKAHSSGKMDAKSIYKNRPQESKDKMAWSRGKSIRPDGEIFSLGGRGNHKKLLILERGHRCECCRNSDWIGKPITLELEHVDGNRINNTRENLKLLCPNCHSQTETWRGKNINSGRVKVTDEEFIVALVETKNIRLALIKLGLTPKGGNYDRARRLLGAIQ
jgi:hypothetical protein